MLKNRCIECLNRIPAEHLERTIRERKEIFINFAPNEECPKNDDDYLSPFEQTCHNCQQKFSKSKHAFELDIELINKQVSLVNNKLDDLKLYFESMDNTDELFSFIEECAYNVGEIIQDTKFVFKSYMDHFVANTNFELTYRFYFENLPFKTISNIEKIQIIYASLFRIHLHSNIKRNKRDYVWKLLKKNSDFKKTIFYDENSLLLSSGSFNRIDARRKQFDHDRTYESHVKISDILELIADVLKYCDCFEKSLNEILNITKSKNQIELQLETQYHVVSGDFSEMDQPEFHVVNEIYNNYNTINLFLRDMFQKIEISQANSKQNELLDLYDIGCRIAEVYRPLIFSLKIYSHIDCNVIDRDDVMNIHYLTNGSVKRVSSIQDKLARFVLRKYTRSGEKAPRIMFEDLKNYYSEIILPQTIITYITGILNSEHYRFTLNYRDRVFHIRDDLKIASNEEIFWGNILTMFHVQRTTEMLMMLYLKVCNYHN